MDSRLNRMTIFGTAFWTDPASNQIRTRNTVDHRSYSSKVSCHQIGANYSKHKRKMWTEKSLHGIVDEPVPCKTGYYRNSKISNFTLFHTIFIFL